MPKSAIRRSGETGKQDILEASKKSVLSSLSVRSIV